MPRHIFHRITASSSVLTMMSITSRAHAFELKNPIGADSFPQVVERFAALLATIGLPIASIFLIYSGYLFVSARGNATQLEEAKKNFWWTIVGTLLLIGAVAIAEAIVNFAKEL